MAFQWMVLHLHGMLDHHHHYQIHLLKEIAETDLIREQMIDLHIEMKDHLEDVQGHQLEVVEIDHVILEGGVPQEEDPAPDPVIVVGKIIVAEVVVQIEAEVIVIEIDPVGRDHVIAEVDQDEIEDPEVEIELDQGEMMIRLINIVLNKAFRCISILFTRMK